jgi:hypothetical protein
MRNRIINGAMVIDQRNAGALINPLADSTYYLDRWKASATQTSKLSIGQNAGSVTPPVGFVNYMGLTSLSAYSITSTDFFGISQLIEGYNVADLGWGTANAKTVTLSFQVYSSLTGTFGGSLRNGAGNRSYPFTFTISSANTWTTISVTIAGDTSGTWLTTNGTGIILFFSLGAGATYSGTANAWAAGNLLSATGATSVVGTNGATFYVTGVQLEVGTQATGFEYRQYTNELALCQRYFINWIGDSAGAVGFPMIGIGYAASSTQGSIVISTPVSLRATPTVTFTGTLSLVDGTSGSVTSITTIYSSSVSGFWGVFNSSGAAFTVGRAILLYCQNASTNSLSATSEL